MTPRRETLCLTILLGVWFAANLATLERAPTVWCDEVLFTDPALHWIQGKGLTSTAWPQPPERPALLNGPLHTVLLCGWLRAWTLMGVGISPTVVRSFGSVLALVAAVWLWALARGCGLVSSPKLRLSGVAAFLCADSVSSAYRSGRYDLVGLLVVLAVVWSVGYRGRSAGMPASAPPAVRLPAVLTTALLAALVPFAGLHLVPYCLLLAVGAVLGAGREWIGRVLPALIGMGVGGLALVGMHLGSGTLPYFIAFTRQQSEAGIAAKLLALPVNAVRDLSVVPLLAYLALCIVLHVGRGGAMFPAGSPRLRYPLTLGRHMPPALLGLAAGIAIPVCMTLAGRYTRYYGWMAFVPVLVVVLRSLERGRPGPGRPTEASGAGEGMVGGRGSEGGRQRGAVSGARAAPAVSSPHAVWTAGLGVAALGVSMALGLPLRTLICLLEWRERDYGKVADFVQAQVRPDDRVVVGHSAYYPVTQIAGTWYLPNALDYMPRADVEAATCIVDRPESAPWTMALTGGTWQMAAEYRPEPPVGRVRLGRALLYHLAVYRRLPPPLGRADSMVPEL